MGSLWESVGEGRAASFALLRRRSGVRDGLSAGVSWFLQWPPQRKMPSRRFTDGARDRLCSSQKELSSECEASGRCAAALTSLFMMTRGDRSSATLDAGPPNPDCALACRFVPFIIAIAIAIAGPMLPCSALPRGNPFESGGRVSLSAAALTSPANRRQPATSFHWTLPS